MGENFTSESFYSARQSRGTLIPNIFASFYVLLGSILVSSIFLVSFSYTHAMFEY